MSTANIAPAPTKGNANSNETFPDMRDNEKGSDVVQPDYANLSDDRRPYAQELAAMSREEYAAFEKKMLWKMDLHIIPWITLLYLISFLDRVNVGAARLVGLMEDLKLTSLMFSNISMSESGPVWPLEQPKEVRTDR